MRLPHELLALVIAHVPARQKRTLAALMSVSSACYALAGRRLYAELRVSSSNLAGVLRGLDRGACDCAAAASPRASSLPPSPGSNTHRSAAPSPTAPASPASPSTPDAGETPPCPAAARTPPASPQPALPSPTAPTPATPPPAPSSGACRACPCSPHDPKARPKARAYPNPASDERKRALLAFTRFLTVESVPDCRCWSPPAPPGPAATAACPLNKALLPNVRVVRVMACVPQHAVVAFERRRR